MSDLLNVLNRYSSTRKIRVLHHISKPASAIGLRAIDVAQDLNMSRQIATYTLNALVKDGVVRKDDRVFYITQKGAKLLA